MKLETIKKTIVSTVCCVHGSSVAAKELNIGVRTVYDILPARKVTASKKKETLEDLKKAIEYLKSLETTLEGETLKDPTKEMQEAEHLVGCSVLITDETHYMFGEIVKVEEAFSNGDIKVANGSKTKVFLVRPSQVNRLEETTNASN